MDDPDATFVPYLPDEPIEWRDFEFVNQNATASDRIQLLMDCLKVDVNAFATDDVPSLWPAWKRMAP